MRTLARSGTGDAMTNIDLDASTWSSPDDVYATLLAALGSPDWHGHNLDALWDSLTSDINVVSPPLRVTVWHADRLEAPIAALLARVSELFSDAREERGLDVGFRIA